jgi:hypothetical protein
LKPAPFQAAATGFQPHISAEIRRFSGNLAISAGLDDFKTNERMNFQPSLPVKRFKTQLTALS